MPIVRHQLNLPPARYRDVFISYGHHPETNDFSHKLAKDLRKESISTWIDTDIEQGSRWREAIQDAIKFSGGMLIILSRKWVDSNYCRGEAALALNLNKPIYVLVPPLSESELVGRSAIPISMKKTLSERQFFTFANRDTYTESVRGLVDALKQSSATSAGRMTRTLSKMELRMTRDPEPLVFRPLGSNKYKRRTSTSSVLPTHEEYVFLCCGGTLEGHFCNALKNAMLDEGITVVVGAAGHHYPQLRRAIIGARVFIFVLAEGDDQVFLQRMLLEAVENKRPIVSVPYMVAPSSEGGFGYTAASTANLRTVCFTDWVGHGLHEHASVFREIFPRLLHEMDDLAGNATDALPALEDVPKLVLHPVKEKRGKDGSAVDLTAQRGGEATSSPAVHPKPKPVWRRRPPRNIRSKTDTDLGGGHDSNITEALRQMDLANYMDQVRSQQRQAQRAPSPEASRPLPPSEPPKRRGRRRPKHGRAEGGALPSAGAPRPPRKDRDRDRKKHSREHRHKRDHKKEVD